jgi:hypothetical protein
MAYPLNADVFGRENVTVPTGGGTNGGEPAER